jgi:hypothetical protein
MSKIIIGIHGLGNKPPKDLLQKWWRQSLREGFRCIDKPQVFFDFELVYWADILHEKPLDINITDPENPLFLIEPYLPGRQIDEEPQGPLRKKIMGYLERQMDKLFLNDDMTLNFSSITDKIIKRYFKDMEAYYAFADPENKTDVKLRRDEIRNRLAETLRKHRDKEILLLSHSMGSIIAYDVLFHTVPDVTVDTFITAGSPLGLPVIIGRIFAEQQKKVANFDKVRTPENVKRNWFNFADPEDTIAFDATLNDDYAENSQNIRAIDITVRNNYENRGVKNSHKIYGYLRTPEMARVIYDFQHRGQPRMKQKLADRLNSLLSGFIEKYK